MRSFIKAFLVSMAINAVWYGTEYLQYRELQWGRHCDDIVSFLYFIVLLYLFEKEKRKGQGDSGKTNFDVCCESIETMAKVIDIMKCGWSRNQITHWLKSPATDMGGKNIKIVYLSDIPIRLKNSRIILEEMESGNIIMREEKRFVTENAEYRFIDCRNQQESIGVYADQAIIDFREPMREIAKKLTAGSCIPDMYRIIDDRKIGTADFPLWKT